jgi:hypothetical protein
VLNNLFNNLSSHGVRSSRVIQHTCTTDDYI